MLKIAGEGCEGSTISDCSVLHLLGTQLQTLLKTGSQGRWTFVPTQFLRELAVILTALGNARTGTTALTARFGS